MFIFWPTDSAYLMVTAANVFFSSRRRHTRSYGDWSSDVCSSDLKVALLSSNSPTFERFSVRSDESTSWVPTTSATIKWLLHPGMNELTARIETRDGWTRSEERRVGKGW